MLNSATLDSISKLISNVLVYLGGVGAVGAFFYFLLKKTTEKIVDARFDERLEKVKHELQLEQQRMSVVYQNQKDSFREVLVAAHKAIEAIEQRIAGEDDWRPISQEDADAFSRVLWRESLFMDDPSDHALRLFREIMLTAVPFEMDVPTGNKVWWAYNQMNFIAERLAEHFRAKVGLPSTVTEPLLDVELLGACRLINRYHFPDHDLPTKGPLKVKENTTAAQLTAVARGTPKLLRAELEKLKEATEKDIFFSEVLTEANRYLHKLDTLKSH